MNPDNPKAKALTAKQETVRRLRYDEGKNAPEIASIMGVGTPTVRKQFLVIAKKLGLDNDRKKMHAIAHAQMTIEHKDPEKAAAVIDAITENPETYENIAEAFKRAGLPKPVSDAMIHRLKVKYQGAVTEVRALKTDEILTVINKKIHLASMYLDDKVLSEASARDLMLGMSALIEKRQLLSGAPTQIVGQLERQRMNDLYPILVAEAQRRGITVEGQVVEKVVNP